MERSNINALLIKNLYTKNNKNFYEKIGLIVTDYQIKDAIKYYKICNCSKCLNCKIKTELEKKIL